MICDRKVFVVDRPDLTNPSIQFGAKSDRRPNGDFKLNGWP